MPRKYAGMWTAIVTPFTKEGAVDEVALRKMVQRQIAGGVTGIVPVGTTGESPTTTTEEDAKIFQIVVEERDKAVGAGVPKVMVMAGAGSAVAEALAAEGIAIELLQLGLPDRFIDHGEQGKLLQLEGLDAAGIERSIRQRFVALLPGAEPRLVASRSA